MRTRRQEGAKTDAKGFFVARGVSSVSGDARHGRDARATCLSSRLRVFAFAWLFLVVIPVSLVRGAEPFILGADISWVPEDEADGATYFDHGVQKDIFQILHDYQFNYIRLRVFVDPRAPHGYAAG